MMRFGIVSIYAIVLTDSALGIRFPTIEALYDAPSEISGDTSEYRIPIGGQEFVAWEREIDNTLLIEMFYELYWKTAGEWDNIYHGEYRGLEYGQRGLSLTDRIDQLTDALYETYSVANKGREPPLWFQNMVTLWMNALLEIVVSVRPRRIFDTEPVKLPEEIKYFVDMLDKDFLEDIRDTSKLGNKQKERLRTTADHLHLLFLPRFSGPSFPGHRDGTHIRSRYEQVARYLVNGLEVSAENGEEIIDQEFQFVVSNLDVSLEHKQVTVYVDPNKTTRMLNTILKIRDKLIRAKSESQRLGWEVRTAMGYLDSIVAGFEPTHPRILKRWQLIKELLTSLSLSFDVLIDGLDGMAEVVRVMEVLSLPETDESIEFEKVFDGISPRPLHYTADFEKPTRSDLHDGNDYTPISQIDGGQAETDTGPLSGLSKALPISINIIDPDEVSKQPMSIPISIDLREPMSTLQLPKSPQESPKQLFTDPSPSARTNLLLPGSSASESGRSPDSTRHGHVRNKSRFSKGSRFSDYIDEN
ncbi:hypothetical protein TWF694_003234 [Orbilia ellipsospora]|uniref:Uncharacterized protein n=1 Tax=Orbilia ellipsospora TaxID=2528407 RepID=A0AAV9X0Y0_9PEZI